MTAAGKGENVEVWSALKTLAWCPVLAQPPEAGMPWPSSKLPLLSPPKLVRIPLVQVLGSASCYGLAMMCLATKLDCMCFGYLHSDAYCAGLNSPVICAFRL